MSDAPDDRRRPRVTEEPTAAPAEEAVVVPPFPQHPRATGTGAWPGTDPLESGRTVLGLLGGEHGLPFLPRLLDRGPGSDPVGLTAGLLVELPVDLQPVGWRLVDHPGADARRASSQRTADLDALAEAADGHTGPLAITVLGPWSLAAGVWLPRAERSVVDPGATRDLRESLVDGLVAHLAHLRRLLPGVDPVLVLDEPDLPALLAGNVPTASGWGRIRAVEPVTASAGLREVVDAVRAAGARTVLRCATADAPVSLLVESGADVVGLDQAGLGTAGWEAAATAVDEGTGLQLRLAAAPVTAQLEQLTRPWRKIGLDVELLDRLLLEPDEDLAAATPERARAVLARLVETAGALAQVAAGG